MTPDQLSTIRARLDAATPGPWELWYGELDWVSVGIDGDTVAECRTHINHQFSGWQNLRNATFIQHAPTDLRALLDEIERLTTELHASQAEVVNLHADPLPAAAWVREVQQAAFARGAEAMREAAAQALSTQGNGYYGLTGSGVAKTIRALPIPEDKS